MKTATRFYCTSRTEATDRANLYYIASPKAARIIKAPEGIQVTTRDGRALAIFSIK